MEHVGNDSFNQYTASIITNDEFATHFYVLIAVLTPHNLQEDHILMSKEGESMIPNTGINDAMNDDNNKCSNDDILGGIYDGILLAPTRSEESRKSSSCSYIEEADAFERHLEELAENTAR